jgi:predicted dehydrogenase
MMRKMDDAIDVVSILTESGYHARDCLALAPYGKHIVVEKPMALTVADADEMIRVCDQAGIKLFVVKQNRYNLPVTKLVEALRSGRFGKIVMGTVRVRWCRPQAYYDQASWRGTWALDGGVFSNQASHHVDLLEWCLGEPVSVVAKSRTALANIEAEDTGVAIITFKSGAIGIVEATTAARPKDTEGSLSILGETGLVEIGGFAVNKMRTWNFTSSLPGDEEVLTRYWEDPPDVYGFGHAAYLADVVKSIEHNAPSLVDGLEGRKSLELISAIYESIESGREVHLRFEQKLGRLGRK